MCALITHVTCDVAAVNKQSSARLPRDTDPCRLRSLLRCYAIQYALYTRASLAAADPAFEPPACAVRPPVHAPDGGFSSPWHAPWLLLIRPMPPRSLRLRLGPLFERLEVCKDIAIESRVCERPLRLLGARLLAALALPRAEW